MSVQVARNLSSDIQSGRLRPGQKLDSVRKLAERYGVGRQVVLSAFNILSKQNKVRTENGRGTFVSPDIQPGYYYRLGYFINQCNPINSPMLHRFRHIALRDGWQAILGSNFEEKFELSDWLKKKKDLDGVIITGVVDEKILKGIEKNCLPYLIMGDYDIKPHHPQITSEFPDKIGLVIKDLVKRHKFESMAVVFGPDYIFSETRLSQAVRKAFEEIGWQDGQGQVIHAFDDGYSEVCRIMRCKPPQAIWFIGEHCVGWRRFCQQHSGPRPFVIVNSNWSDILEREFYDLEHDSTDYCNLLERTFYKMMELLKVKV